eukprot:TRINITY_DN2297_c0_g1_i3.p1 TRINITY_DN2297_c0_g1~~TRINITY_DN2297_c0_g1_i3.p1  ORF type:complete len:269 (-),score=33.91 TRINITY_DN2297_c0_g1_i3:87-893(-)
MIVGFFFNYVGLIFCIIINLLSYLLCFIIVSPIILLCQWLAKRAEYPDKFDADEFPIPLEKSDTEEAVLNIYWPFPPELSPKDTYDELRASLCTVYLVQENHLYLVKDGNIEVSAHREKNGRSVIKAASGDVLGHIYSFVNEEDRRPQKYLFTDPKDKNELAGCYFHRTPFVRYLFWYCLGDVPENAPNLILAKAQRLGIDPITLITDRTHRDSSRFWKFEMINDKRIPQPFTPQVYMLSCALNAVESREWDKTFSFRGQVKRLLGLN